MAALTAATRASSLGRLEISSTAFFLCDVQEKFRNAIQFYPQVIDACNKLVEAGKKLNIPTVVTEQYPKGLGNTVSEINIQGLPVFSKTKFSMWIPEVKDLIEKRDVPVKSIVLFGIETQVCVQQTALDLLGSGYDVHIVADAVSSRTLMDRKVAIKRMQNAGAFVSTSESILLELLGGSHHAQFKEIQKLIIKQTQEIPSRI